MAPSTTKSIIHHLLTTPPYPTSLRLATQPPFLRHAGLGKIPTPLLAAYLSQDRLYQHAYIRFVAGMLTKIRFASSQSSPPSSSSSAEEEEDRLPLKTTHALIDALNAIRSELEFFERVAEKYGFGLMTPMPPSSEAGPTPITRAYTDFFSSVSGPGASLLEGLVALWGTEKCYLEAWRWARTFASAGHSAAGEGSGSGVDTDSTGGSGVGSGVGVGVGGGSKSYASDADGGAIRGELLPSWTSEAFAEVVEAMGRLADEVAVVEERRVGTEAVEARCGEVWRQILWLEERFWPGVEG